MGGWRALGLFWAVVLAVVLLGAGALAVLGPPAASTGAVAGSAVYHGNNTAWPGPPAARHIGAPIRGPDPALLEPAPAFPGAKLPRIGPDRRRPAETYAAFADASSPGVKLGLVVAGLGLDHADSLAAIRALPAAVDFAVSAYAIDTVGVLEAARNSGHEMLLSLPMEPAGYPSADEGDHALLTTATPAENARNLQWALSRIEGYAGVTGASDGQRGERYAASLAAMGSLGAELARRGLFYVDPRPGAEPPGGVEARAVDQVIDSADDAERQLSALEQAAREHGTAIGLIARPSPVMVGRLSAWAASLAARGFTMVPTSTLVVRRASR